MLPKREQERCRESRTVAPCKHGGNLPPAAFSTCRGTIPLACLHALAPPNGVNDDLVALQHRRVVAHRVAQQGHVVGVQVGLLGQPQQQVEVGDALLQSSSRSGSSAGCSSSANGHGTATRWLGAPCTTPSAARPPRPAQRCPPPAHVTHHVRPRAAALPQHLAQISLGLRSSTPKQEPSFDRGPPIALANPLVLGLVPNPSAGRAAVVRTAHTCAACPPRGAPPPLSRRPHAPAAPACSPRGSCWTGGPGAAGS